MEKSQNENKEAALILPEQLAKVVAGLFGPVDSPETGEAVMSIHDSHILPLIIRDGRPIISTFDYPPEKVQNSAVAFRTSWTEDLPTRVVSRGRELQKARLYYLYEHKRSRVLIEMIFSHSPYHVTEFEWGQQSDEVKVRLWQGQASRVPEPEHINYLYDIVSKMQAEYCRPKTT